MRPSLYEEEAQTIGDRRRAVGHDRDIRRSGCNRSRGGDCVGDRGGYRGHNHRGSGELLESMLNQIVDNFWATAIYIELRIRISNAESTIQESARRVAVWDWSPYGWKMGEDA
jgi:hypothetical protein